MLDQECGIKEITPAELDSIWRLVTGGSIYKELRSSELSEAVERSKDGYVRQVKDAWPTAKIFTHFGVDGAGTEADDGETRILGNGGLLISADGSQWYCHSESIGGDNFDAWAWCKTGERAERQDAAAFMALVNEMGDEAGIERPKKAGRPAQEAATSAQMIANLKSLGHEFRLNVLEDMVEIDGKRMDDVARSAIVLKMMDYKIAQTYVDHVINVVAAENAYHPVKDYLNGLQWDGKNHLKSLMKFITGDGTDVVYSNGVRSPLHWALFSRWLVGCVARALDGDKDDAFKHQTPMLVFVGGQGIGKSSLVRWLASGIGYEFHRESPLDPHNIESERSAVTKWIWEVSELGGSLRKADREAVKSFLTQEWHTYRKPWGRANITKPTLCNFVGTINKETGFLDDPTGHRRFLPVNITALDKTYKDKVDVNQLWAQVVHLYKAGEMSPELEPSERQALEATYKTHEVENPLQTYVQMYFNVEPGNASLRCFTVDILRRLQLADIRLSTSPKAAGRELNDALAPLGLERKLLSINGVKGWGWVGIGPKLANEDGTW